MKVEKARGSEQEKKKKRKRETQIMKERETETETERDREREREGNREYQRAAKRDRKQEKREKRLIWWLERKEQDSVDMLRSKCSGRQTHGKTVQKKGRNWTRSTTYDINKYNWKDDEREEENVVP